MNKGRPVLCTEKLSVTEGMEVNISYKGRPKLCAERLKLFASDLPPVGKRFANRLRRAVIWHRFKNLFNFFRRQ